MEDRGQIMACPVDPPPLIRASISNLLSMLVRLSGPRMLIRSVSRGK